jgi:hypothetical protein
MSRTPWLNKSPALQKTSEITKFLVDDDSNQPHQTRSVRQQGGSDTQIAAGQLLVLSPAFL